MIFDKNNKSIHGKNLFIFNTCLYEWEYVGRLQKYQHTDKPFAIYFNK